MSTATDTKFKPEDYTKAMNEIGQNLLNALSNTAATMPAQLRTTDMIMQGVATFLANVLHRQFPKDVASRDQLHEYLTHLVSKQLSTIKP
jgi:hypothetical protein